MEIAPEDFQEYRIPQEPILIDERVEIIRDYLTLLNILRDNENATFDKLMEDISFTEGKGDEEEKSIDVPASSKTKISIFDIDI